MHRLHPYLHEIGSTPLHSRQLVTSPKDNHGQQVINIAYATFIVEDSYKSLTCFGPIPVALSNSI